MKRLMFVLVFILLVSILFAHDFDGSWYAKFELNEKYEEGVVFKDVEIKSDVVYIKGVEKEFRVLNNFYIIYDGKKYSYGTRHNMIVLYGLKDYQFSRILFLKSLRE